MEKFVVVLGVVGVVKYVTSEGLIGVNLVNEGKRIDEWHPTQVKEISPSEAAVLYAASRI